MEKRTKIILIVLGVLLLVLLLLWLLTRYFGSRQPQEESEGTAGNIYPLRFGSESKEGGVKTLQLICNDILGSRITPLAVDGIWGSKTENAVKELTFFSINKRSDNYYEQSFPFSRFIGEEDGHFYVNSISDLNKIIEIAKAYNESNGDYDTVSLAMN